MLVVQFPDFMIPVSAFKWLSTNPNEKMAKEENRNQKNEEGHSGTVLMCRTHFLLYFYGWNGPAFHFLSLKGKRSGRLFGEYRRQEHFPRNVPCAYSRVFFGQKRAFLSKAKKKKKTLKTPLFFFLPPFTYQAQCSIYKGGEQTNDEKKNALSPFFSRSVTWHNIRRALQPLRCRIHPLFFFFSFLSLLFFYFSFFFSPYPGTRHFSWKKKQDIEPPVIDNGPISYVFFIYCSV